jgi:hypothetical protein
MEIVLFRKLTTLGLMACAVIIAKPGHLDNGRAKVIIIDAEHVRLTVVLVGNCEEARFSNGRQLLYASTDKVA